MSEKKQPNLFESEKVCENCFFFNPSHINRQTGLRMGKCIIDDDLEKEVHTRQTCTSWSDAKGGNS